MRPVVHKSRFRFNASNYINQLDNSPQACSAVKMSHRHSRGQEHTKTDNGDAQKLIEGNF